MNGNNVGASRRQREQRLSRVLLVAAALLLFCGLFVQIALRARISGQSKQIAAVQAEIRQLSAQAGNLDLNINQRHDLEEIGRRAVQLGMEQPDESQLRVVYLPAAAEDTSTQTVVHDSGEKMSG